jgi:hypothetical protein
MSKSLNANSTSSSTAKTLSRRTCFGCRNLSCGVRNDGDPALALLEHVKGVYHEDCRMHRSGIAYAGTAYVEIMELLVLSSEESGEAIRTKTTFFGGSHFFAGACSWIDVCWQ